MGRKVKAPVVDDVPIRKKQPVIEEVGRHLAFDDGSVWQITGINWSGRMVVCVASGKLNDKGKTTTISRHPTAARYIEGEELAGLVEQAEAAALSARICETCRAIKAGELEGACPEHAKPGRPAPRAGRFIPTEAEIQAVLKLRAAGMGYAEIEKEMGWPDGHGNRPWRIVKEHGAKEA